MHMIKRLGNKLAVLLFISITFISCASVPPSIPVSAMQSVQKVDIYIGHPEATMVYQRHAKGAKTGAVVAGLLGVLVAETISRGTHAKWEHPGNLIAAQLDGMDHATAIENALQESLDRTSIDYDIFRVEELQDIFRRTEVIEEIIDYSTADIVLVLSYDFSLQQGFDLHISGYSAAYAVSEQSQQYADAEQRIVFRLLDDVILMKHEKTGTGTPDEIASQIMADSRILQDQVDHASQLVVAELVSMLGKGASEHNTRRQISTR